MFARVTTFQAAMRDYEVGHYLVGGGFPDKLDISRNRSVPFLVEEVQLPREAYVSILWIILIVVLVLALLGFVGR